MIRPGFSPTTGKVKQTLGSKKVSFCQKEFCCQDVPTTLKCYVWAESGISESPLEHGCDTFNLSRSSLAGGGYKWTGNATQSVWQDCIFEDTFEVELRCSDPAGSNFAMDDCVGAMGILVESDPLASGTDVCCCDPVCFTGRTLLANSSAGTLEMLTSGEGEACSPDLWNDGGDVTFYFWIYDANGDDNGDICCHADPCPPTYGACSGNPCDSTPCTHCDDVNQSFKTWRIDGVASGNACCKWIRDIHKLNWDNSCSYDFSDSTCNTRSDWTILIQVSIASSAITATVTFTKSGESSYAIDYSVSITSPINCASEWTLGYDTVSGSAASDPCVDTDWSATDFILNPNQSDTS